MTAEVVDNHWLLGALEEDASNVPELYKPGPYWKPYIDRMTKRLYKESISHFRANAMLSKGFADVIRSLPIDFDQSLGARAIAMAASLPGIRDALRSREDALLCARKESAELSGKIFFLEESWFPKFVRALGWPSDTTAGGCEAITRCPVELADLMGPTTSTYYLKHATRIRDFEKSAPASQARSYMEIGGGFGGFTHLLLTWRPNIRKVILVDLPPVIYIATQYLRAHFGEAVRDYCSVRGKDINLCDDDILEIYCLPPWCIEEISEGKIDLFHNSASFSEMTPDIVRNYASHWRRLASETAKLWLFLNKTRARENIELAMPSDILEIFNWANLEISKEVPGMLLSGQVSGAARLERGAPGTVGS